MITHKRGQDLIKEFEGYSGTVYLCPAGKPTVGWGHVVLPQDQLKLGDKITEARATAFLMADIVETERGISSAMAKDHVVLTQNQFDALVSFAYNVGLGNLLSSTLWHKIKVADYDGAAAQFDRWVYANGKVLRGLINRRKAERALFEVKDVL